MLEVVKHGILLSKTTLDFENEAVCNPAIIKNKEGIHMFYRAVSARNYSSIGYCKLSDPVTISSRLDTGLIVSQYEYEMHGVEDPRIVCIDNVYFLTYTAYDGINALGALALSDDLINFKKMGILVPRITNTEFRELAATKNGLYDKYVEYNEYNLSSETQHRTEYLWNKNVIFFPRRINGSIWFLHRIRPDIFIVEISDLSDLTHVKYDTNRNGARGQYANKFSETFFFILCTLQWCSFSYFYRCVFCTNCAPFVAYFTCARR